MKTLICLCLSVLACNLSWAQSITVLDSFHLYIYEDDEWNLSSGDIYSQMSDGSVIANQFAITDDNERSFTHRITANFDENGNEVQNLVSVLDEATGEFLPNTLSIYAFDAENNLTERVRQLYNEETHDWVNVEKWEYTEYDAFNNFGKTENFNHTEADGWLLANSILLDNGYENDLLDTVSAFRNGEQWYTRAFDYDGADLLMENRTVFYFNGEINHLTRSNFEYNSLEEREWRMYGSYTPAAGETDSILRYRDNFEYDTDGNLFRLTNEDYDTDNSDYQFDERSVYFYPQVTSVDDLDESLISVQWRNNKFNQLELQIGDLSANENYRLSIFNGSGKMVKNLLINQESQWSNNYSLSSGMYYVVIRSASGLTHTEKVIVQ